MKCLTRSTECACESSRKAEKHGTKVRGCDGAITAAPVPSPPSFPLLQTLIFSPLPFAPDDRQPECRRTPLKAFIYDRLVSTLTF